MKQWGLFLLSVGSFLIMMSSIDGYKFGTMITGITMIIGGAVMVWKKKEK